MDRLIGVIPLIKVKYVDEIPSWIRWNVVPIPEHRPADLQVYDEKLIRKTKKMAAYHNVKPHPCIENLVLDDNWCKQT